MKIATRQETQRRKGLDDMHSEAVTHLLVDQEDMLRQRVELTNQQRWRSTTLLPQHIVIAAHGVDAE